MNRCDHQQSEMSDAEVLTTALVAMFAVATMLRPGGG
jgi:hypothetical protein